VKQPTAARRKPRLSDTRAASLLAPPTQRELAIRGALAGPPAPRVFGYVRVSTDEQAESGQSLDVQRRQLEGWAQMCGRNIDHFVIEPGVSATKEFIKRPEGGKLWAELRKGDILVGVKMDRMFRNTRDCLNTVHAMQQRGISFRLLDLGGGMDELTANGMSQFFMHVMAAVAQFESARIGERIRATKRAQKDRGEYLGGPPPFGWRHDTEGGKRRLVPIPEEQRALRRIAEMTAEGLSPYRISADLKERGTPLSHVTIRKVIAGRPTP
jgi:putative DNA-invertase from lambdoid prophage Rac